MSLVPLLFRDWWEDFERERLPRRLLDQHFGLGLHRDDLTSLTSALPSPSLRPGGTYYRPWQGVAFNRQNSGTSNLKSDEKQVQVILDVQQFGPGEITVKTSEGAVIVEGKHEEKQDEHGYVSRHFKRRYLLPKDVDMDQIMSSLSSDGVLTVSVPKKVLISLSLYLSFFFTHARTHVTFRIIMIDYDPSNQPRTSFHNYELLTPKFIRANFQCPLGTILMKVGLYNLF